MDASSLLAAFASAFTQDRRLFSLRFTDPSLDSELLPHTVSGEEHVSAPFRLAVECLSSDIHRELKSLIGLGVDIAIQCGDGSERVLSGIVTAAQQLGSDGGFARYGLTVEPAFATLQLRRNSRVFQDKSVVDIVGLILDEHIAANPVFAQCFRHRAQLTQSYPPRNYCQQYRESDYAFIERLLREEGISYVFDFAGDVGLHTLVLFDSGSELEAAPQASIRFHRADATEADDTLTDWHAHRQIRSGGVSLARFDYKGVYTQQGAEQTAVDHGEYGNGLGAGLQDYDPRALLVDYKEGSSNNGDLNRYATLRQQANDLLAKSFRGSGVVRGLGAGQWFTLEQHPAHEDDGAAQREFIVLRQTFSARNNLPGEFETLSVGAVDAHDQAGYQNHFDAVRKSAPIVPLYSHTQHDKPSARGTQTATVVGPAGEEIFTDELGRIKIQFHWARAADHDVGQHGASAEKNDFSSCWVRVMMPSAGAHWGHQFIPRIGQEVMVDFIEGDIDRPVVVRTLHNGQHTPPTFGNAGSLPANRTLSGIKSHEYKGSRHNEIIFDDTASELRTTLSTEHGKTQLHQGYLIHPRSEGKGTPRGEGFELRTDNAGAIRAAQGLLITTEPQPNAGGNQLDRSGALAQLQAAQNLTQQLGDTANAQNANQPNPEPKLDTDHLQQKTAHLLLSAHGGFIATTPQSMAIAAGKNVDQVAQRDTHQTSGRRWIHNAGESISLFVAGAQNKLKDTFKLIAAKGNILIQAQNNDVEITADKKITLTACKEKLTATAGKTFLLQSGGGYIKFSGGNIDIHCPGTLSMKAANFVHQGGGSGSASVPAIPRGAAASIDSFVQQLASEAQQNMAALGLPSSINRNLPNQLQGTLSNQSLQAPSGTPKDAQFDAMYSRENLVKYNGETHLGLSQSLRDGLIAEAQGAGIAKVVGTGLKMARDGAALLTATKPTVSASEYGVAFFGKDNLPYYTAANATIGRSGKTFFFMPLDDSAAVKNAADAARYTGRAPSAEAAHMSGEDIYGLSFPTTGMKISKPTAGDAGGWPHFLEGGHTAVRTGSGPNAGYLVNSTREFVTPGGNAVPPGSALFKLGEQGEWIPIRGF